MLSDKYRSIFRFEIWQKGMKLAGNSVVDKSFTEVNDGIQVTGDVLDDGDAFTVNCWFDKRDILQKGMCTCSLARSGIRCAHMAALLITLGYSRVSEIMRREQNKQRKDQERADELARYLRTRKPCRPFMTKPGERPSYFDLDQMTSSYVIYDLDYENAKVMAETWKNSNNYIVRSGYTTLDSLRCLELRCPNTSAFLLHDRIYDLRCDDRKCKGFGDGSYIENEKKVLCRHALATLELINCLTHTDQALADATDYNAALLMDRWRKGSLFSGHGSEDTVKKDVFLEPTLCRTGKNEYGLVFRIGRDKAYTVKNISELTDKVSMGRKYELGKNGEIDFSLEGFDDKSRLYYDMIVRTVEVTRFSDDRIRSRSWISSSTTVPDLKSMLPLFGNMWDTFFNIASSSVLNYEDRYDRENKGKKGSVRFDEKEFSIKLTLKPMKEHDVIYGLTLEGDFPQLIEGSQYEYRLVDDNDDKVLLRLTGDTAGKLKVFSNMSRDGRVSLCVGQGNLPEFFFSVLPEIRKLAEVTEEDIGSVVDFMPAEPVFVLYLDAIDRQPVCSPAVFYDDIRYALPDDGTAPPRGRVSYLEEKAMSLVNKWFTSFDVQKQCFFAEGDDESVCTLIETGLSELENVFQLQCTAAFDNLRIRKIHTMQLGVSLSGDMLNLHIETGELTAQELLDALESYRLKKKYHRLSGGGFLRLDDQIGEISSMLENLHLLPKELLKKKLQIPSYRALYLDKMLEKSEAFYVERNRELKRLVKEFKTIEDCDFEAPESMQQVLRTYQVQGYKWLRTLAHNHFGGILADDMGLGKTIQMIAVLLAEKEEGNHGTSLVVCPASLVYNWREEFTRFAPDLKVAAAAGVKKEREEMLSAWQDWDVLITSYELLKRDILIYQECSFLYAVLDEAQFIKTHSTAAAKTVKLLKASHRFALTGTPIENRLSELWSIFDFLMPGFLYPYETFRKEIETPIVKREDNRASERLRRMTGPFILRRLKKDVLRDLPDKIEEERCVILEGEQRKLYDAQVVRMRALLQKQSNEDVNRNKIQILAELTRIRRICCDPSLMFEDYTDASAKREACIELIESAMAGEHRMLVFSQFTGMLALLEKDLKEREIPYYLLTGSTPKEERINMVKAFNEGDTPVFLISLKAGGTGLNLIGADVVIHYDPWWNVAAQNQATDRAHRIGQSRDVTVYKLICKNTIEEKIVKLQQDKAKLAEDILGSDGTGIGSLNKDDLLALLA